jgi:hypothetical protein
MGQSYLEGTEASAACESRGKRGSHDGSGVAKQTAKTHHCRNIGVTPFKTGRRAVAIMLGTAQMPKFGGVLIATDVVMVN